MKIGMFVSTLIASFLADGIVEIDCVSLGNGDKKAVRFFFGISERKSLEDSNLCKID